MKTFEERYTAWVDGKLTGRDLAQFEKETTPDLLSDKANLKRLGDLLRAHTETPPMPNADFFSHQIMHRIRMDSPPPYRRRRRGWTWSISQLAWAGAASLLAALALYKAFVPVTEPPGGEPYFAEIIDVRTSDPSISATPVYDPRDNVTVLWIEGLDYLPASYKLQ